MNEVWIFADFNSIDEDELKLLQDIKATDVVLGIAGVESKSFELAFSADTIRANCAQLKAVGINPHLMIWLRRSKQFINDSAEVIVPLVTECEPASLMFDVEGHWHKGRYNVQDASELVKQVYRDELPNCPIGVTGLSRMHDTVEILSDTIAADYVIPQAYSVWKPTKDKHWSHSSSTEPGDMQMASYTSWMDGKSWRMIMGLGVYWLRRPSRDGKEAMVDGDNLNICIDATRQLGVDSVAYWSLKHIKNPLRKNFITSLRGTPEGLMPSDEAVQWLLVKLGYNIGDAGELGVGIDGDWGVKCKAALKQYQQSKVMPQSDYYSLNDVCMMVNDFRLTQPD